MRTFNEEYVFEISKILNKHHIKIPIQCTIEIAKYMTDEVFYAICDARGD